MNKQFSVWTEATRRYYYLIPQDYELPPGDFVLWSPLGGQKQVDPLVLVPFEVTEEVARQYFRAEANPLTGNIQDTLANLFAFATQSMPKQDEAFIKWVVGFLGGSPEELERNPQEAFLQLLQRVKDMVAGKVEPTPEMKSALQVDWAQVTEQLNKITFEQNEQLQQALSDLQQLITGLRDSANPKADNALRALYQRHQEAVQHHQAADNQRKYQAEVSRSIDEALQKSMKPIDVKSWIEEAKANYRQEKKGADSKTG